MDSPSEEEPPISPETVEDVAEESLVEETAQAEIIDDPQKEPETEPEEDWDAELNQGGDNDDANATDDPPDTSQVVDQDVVEPQAEPEEDWDAELKLSGDNADADTPKDEPAQVISIVEPDADEDWDIEMDLGKTGGAKALPSPPPSASSNGSWHGSMAAVAATSGFTGTVTRLGAGPKSDVEESWDDFDFDIMSSEETSKVTAPNSNSVSHTRLDADMSDWDDDDDANAQTIKMPAGQPIIPKKPILFTPAKKATPPVAVEEEDFEDDFAFPEDLAHLSLRPLKRRPSKGNMLEGWGDTTLSSSTSEAPSLGFDASTSPSSNSNSIYSHGDPETEDDDEETLLDGLVLPEGLFDSEKSGRQLHKILEERKKTALNELPTIIASPQEDDFESGLVIDDDVDFDLSKVKHHRPTLSNGRSSKGLSLQPPPRPPSAGPPSRAQSLTGSPEMTRASLQRSKSPLGRTFASVARSPSPIRARAPVPLSASAIEGRSSFHSPLGSLMSPSSPPPSSFHGTPTRDPVKRQLSAGRLQADAQKTIARKSSLSSIDVSTTTSGNSVRVTLKRPSSVLDHNSPPQPRRPPLFPVSSAAYPGPGRYNTPASARSKSTNTPLSPATMYSLSSVSRLQQLQIQQSPNLVPATPPGTPSSNPIALRLTMSTSSSRAKSRTPLTSVFPGASMHALPRPTSFAAAVKSPPGTVRSPTMAPIAQPQPQSYTYVPTPPTRTISSPSPLRTRAPLLSRSSMVSAVSSAVPRPPQAKIMKRPKRLRAYGDGTELDGIEDLPTDRDQEGKYRVAPKGYSSGGRVVRSGSGAGRGSGDWTPTNEGGLNDSTGSNGSKAAQRRRADLSSNRASVSSSATATPSLGKATLSPLSSPKTPLNDKRRSFGSMPLKRRPMLIRNLNKVGTAKVVGEMRWNPQTLRWEGNDHVLRDFDNAMSSSTRPALITQLSASALGSPVSSTTGIPGARVVGNMLFDPIKMCWVSQLPPEEEEPDVFADMADDEDDAGSEWEKSKGGTIRGLANFRVAPPSPRPSAPPGKVIIDRVSPARGGAGVLVVVGAAGDGNPSPSHSTHSHSQSELESGSERGYGSLEQERLSKEGDDVEGGIVSQKLQEETGLAEKRHQDEMKGWFVDPLSEAPNSFAFPAYGQDLAHSEMDRAYLYELRTIATSNLSQS